MARLFVAIHPPRATTVALLEALGEVEGLPEHRVTPPHRMHLTVLFVGEVEPRDLERCAESVERAASGVRAFELHPQTLITLPQSGAARLIAAGVDGCSDLSELRKRLAQRLSSARRRERTFLPHLTLCRFPRPTDFAVEERPLELAPFAVDEVALMESRTTPGGNEYRLVTRVELPQSRKGR